MKERDAEISMYMPIEEIVIRAGIAAMSGICAGIRTTKQDGELMFSEKDIKAAAIIAHSLATRFASIHMAWCSDNESIKEKAHEGDADSVTEWTRRVALIGKFKS